MRVTKKSAYTRPNHPCWVKVINTLTDSTFGIKEGSIYPVAQVLWDKERGTTPIKIKSPTTGQLIGLYPHEFAYCDEDGEYLS